MIATRDVDIDELQELVGMGYLALRAHPTAPLTIANYTAKAQYDRVWDQHPILLECRGLIFDDSGQIRARGFRKFFNRGELQGVNFPEEPPEVTEKLDGSLGISYFVDGQIAIATRGSFDSPQARWATEWAREHLELPRDAQLAELSLCFEILYPANRVVVDYGERAELVLLGVVDNRNGHEWEFDLVEMLSKRIGVRVVDLVHHADWQTLAATDRKNFEGYVLFWPSTQQRVKVKLPSYVELHRMVHDFSAHRVWEAMRDERLDQLLEGAPDEVFGWARLIQGNLRDAFNVLRLKVERVTQEAREYGARKEQAAWILANHKDISDLVFRALDGRQYQLILWKHLEPAADEGRFHYGNGEEAE